MFDGAPQLAMFDYWRVRKVQPNDRTWNLSVPQLFKRVAGHVQSVPRDA